ncbi:integrin-linked protein kinase 1-like isoform X2 [Phragmites australis]|uniref:integrin-linked protein kinase 1-like isoform X2 n=1 Tax=Phragmites australis TaxID=29695 RepID=UPI002D79742F|nr:integrin-linked protein kinase 1-like isoform X2 [Phragmites australis]
METMSPAAAAVPTTPQFRLGKQSSLAPVHGEGGAGAAEVSAEANGVMSFQLMYLVHGGNAEGIRDLLDAGADPNFRDSDGRTALHIAACEGHTEIAELLLQRGAEAAAEDQWGSTGTYRKATWRGIPVAVKKLDDDLIMDENKVQAFRDELDVLQLIRHPNVVQFLGAVTQSSPMMIVMEFMRKGDLRTHLNKKGALAPSYAVKLALDIARGMSYLHEHKPQAIIHRDLEPSNILRDDTGHLKVADFDLCKMLKWRRKIREERAVTSPGNACRYVAPEVLRNEEYDTKVDIFSFALIVQEMIEGCLPYHDKKNGEIEKAHNSKERPHFRAHPKHYAHGLRGLIEECWSENPADRPDFSEIIDRLSAIQNEIAQRNRWKVRPLRCFLSFEGMWKKDRNEGSTTRSSRLSRSNF